jgi:FixJ family two-component response regulator
LATVVAAVDDDFRVRESLGRLMESAGYAPAIFLSADALLQSAALSGAACVITDVRMPGMDGLELQRRLKVNYPELPVIFISAHVDDETRRRAFDGGAIDFIYKPFDGAELLRAIDRAVNRSPADPV